MTSANGGFLIAVLDLPIWLVGIIVVGGAAALGVALVYGLDLFVKRHRGDEYNSVVSDGLQAVVAYIHSVMDDEWPALADGVGSPQTSKAIDHL